jgi:hypothetical protein
MAPTVDLFSQQSVGEVFPSGRKDLFDGLQDGLGEEGRAVRALLDPASP